MTSNLDLDSRQLAALQKAERALVELAEVGNKAAKEHLHALDFCRMGFTQIDALLKPHFYLERTTVENVGALFAAWQEDQQALTTARATVARLEDADRLLRESHLAVVAENARLRENLDANVLLRRLGEDRFREVEAAARTFVPNWFEHNTQGEALDKAEAENVRLREEVARLGTLLENAEEELRSGEPG
jgi:hypothetical protein